MKIQIPGLQEIEAAAARFAQAREGRNVVAFRGGMGAGKTTFIAALCKVLGVTDAVNSPTFSIVNHYETTGGQTVYHFDFYRLESARQALDIGAEDYFFSGSLCLVEWPENVADAMPDDTLYVDIDIAPDGVRTLCFEP